MPEKVVGTAQPPRDEAESIKERIRTTLDKVSSLKTATITAAAIDAISISAALATKASESFTPMIPVVPQIC